MTSYTGINLNFDDNEEGLDKRYLTFVINKELFSIPIKSVLEIVEMQKIIAVPDVANYIKGVVNLRGKVIPVVDLRIRFHIDKKDYDDRTCIIIIEYEEVTVGFIVDSVEEVLIIDDSKIDPSPSLGNKKHENKYIRGIGKFNKKIVIILDIEKVLYE